MKINMCRSKMKFKSQQAYGQPENILGPKKINNIKYFVI